MQPKLHQLCGGLALASVLFLSACSKSDSSEPQNDNAGKFSYEMQAINPNTSIMGDAAGIERLAQITNTPEMARTTTDQMFGFTWTEVKVRVREVKFEAKKGNDQVNFSAKIDQMVDVLKAAGFIGMIDLPKGTYKSVKLSVKAAGDEQNPAAILGGKITWQGKDIPFSIRLAGTINFKADARDVVVGDSSLSLKGKLKLDLKIVAAKLQLGDFDGTFSGGHLTIIIDLDGKDKDKDKCKRMRNGWESCMRCD